MAKAVRLSDIGAKLGVSTVTVSKALSGQKGVSEEMRERIKELAEEMGYKRPVDLRREAAGRNFNIGVLIHEQYLGKYNSFYLQLYQLLAVKAVSKECFTFMESVTMEMEQTQVLPKLITEEKADGLIVVGRLSDGYLSFLSSNVHVPILFLDFCNENLDVDAVISDSFYGAYYLTNYLFDQGHENIGYVGTLLATGSITDRYLGYTKSLMEHGKTARQEWILGDRDEKTGFMSPDYMKIPDNLPTAFVCNCDLAACMLIKKLEENGIHVPEDVSVVGYDNFLFPGLSEIDITTYEVDMKEMARRAVNTLIKKMRGESYHSGIIIVEGHIVLKDSVRNIGAGNKEEEF